MMHIVRFGKQFKVFKTYGKGARQYSRVVYTTTDLKKARKLCEEAEASAVPANNVGDGKIQGLDLGYPNQIKELGKRKKKQPWIFSRRLPNS